MANNARSILRLASPASRSVNQHVNSKSITPRRGRWSLYIRSWDTRLWSNDCLRHIGTELTDCKSVVNVSGWKDSDKEGGFYRSYFPHAARYSVSNHPLDDKKGVLTGRGVALDLEQELPEELKSSCDVALNHTVLEHVRNPWFAFRQIVRMARVGVITIVPFKQPLHFEPGNFGDYFRFSPMALREMYEKEGLVPVHEAFSRGFNSVYVVCFGTRPEFSNNYPALSTCLEYQNINHTLGHSGPSDLLKSVGSRLLRALAR
jgi:hypothetical protein